jgi:hypothetical protein
MCRILLPYLWPLGPIQKATSRKRQVHDDANDFIHATFGKARTDFSGNLIHSDWLPLNDRLNDDLLNDLPQSIQCRLPF